MQLRSSELTPFESLQASEKGLFFVIGCGRSGTTLLQVMLDSHSAIVMPNETQFYTSFSRSTRSVAVKESNLEQCVDAMLTFEHIRPMNLPRDRVQELAKAGDATWDTIFLAILTAFREVRGGERVGEKTPAHYNTLWHLFEVFPDAKFISLIRDPRGVVDSYMKAPFYRNFGRNPMHAIHSWRMAIDKHEEAVVRAPNDRYTSVRYEDLVNQPEVELQRLCQFLAVDFEPQMLEFHRRQFSGFLEGESHKMGTLKPVYKDSTEKWRNSLTKAQVNVIEGILGSRMRAQGYATEVNKGSTRLQEWYLYATYKGRVRSRKVLQKLGLLKRMELGGIAETEAASDENR